MARLLAGAGGVSHGRVKGAWEVRALRGAVMFLDPLLLYEAAFSTGWLSHQQLGEKSWRL